MNKNLIETYKQIYESQIKMYERAYIHIPSDGIKNKLTKTQNKLTYVINFDNYEDYEGSTVQSKLETLFNDPDAELLNELGVDPDNYTYTREFMEQVNPKDPDSIWNTECYYHQWATYKGFTETYEYCEICDTKRPLPSALID